MRRFFRRLASRSARRGYALPANARFKQVAGHPVEVQIMGPNSIDVLRARDVSAEGIGVLVPLRFEGCDIDSQVELVVSLPRQRPFVAHGRVRHATEGGGGSDCFGVHFTQLSPEHRRRLEAYLDSGLAEPIRSRDAV